jgi:galactose-1-phosphate uridylyltransferase
MGIWQHTHTLTTTEVSPDLGELAEILDDVSVEMMQLNYCTTCYVMMTSMLCSFFYVLFLRLTGI